MRQPTTCRPKISKSRNGCGECKRKRMKCDESLPQCQNCAHRNVECPGYSRALKWSTKYEKFASPSPPAPPPCPRVVLAGGDAAGTQLPPSPGASPDRRAGDGAARDARVTTPAPTPGPADLPHGDHRNPPPDPESDADADADAAAADDDDDDLCPGPVPDAASLLPPGLRRHLAAWGDFPPTGGHRSVDRLFPHYFSTVCRVMSCFDSATNPYRTHIPGVLHRSPYIFNCMMGMAAAHMANYDKEMAVTAISYQTEAMQSLQLQMSGLLPSSNVSRVNLLGSTYETLLGTIMLGMTSAWHDPNASGMLHLRGARLLFRTWSTEQQLYDAGGKVTILNREQSFIVGSMAYWECLASFITDQPINAVGYLQPFCQLAKGQTVYPHAWTGVSTPLFILTAQVGILLRQKRVLEKLSLIRRGADAKAGLDLDLLHDASGLHDKIMEYDLPHAESMENTGDPNTPLQHLCEVAKLYRFAALLELYRAFPLLAQPPIPTGIPLDPPKVQIDADDLAFDLATSIITIISHMPRESGVYTVICIPLICAGAALQVCPPTSSHVPKGGDLGAERNHTRRSRSTVDRWREEIRQQILHTSRQIGLAAFKRVAKLVQEVWTWSDLHVEMAADSETPIHWIDVMMEQHLETLFG